MKPFFRLRLCHGLFSGGVESAASGCEMLNQVRHDS